MLEGKKILLGITGSIAAYKAPLIVRELIKKGAEVKVIATTSALDFVAPLTLSTLSKHPVHAEFSNSKTGEWINHVELALWADVFLIAPASANTIAKMANGLCDNLLMAVYLSAKCPVFLAPAMDLDMHQHPSFRANMEVLGKYGNRIIEATSGELASGLIGQGRMEEPTEIVKALESYFASKQLLKGKKALVTAGPTYEAIDPVRFIGNHSSGKMGYAIAESLAEHGAEVVLISGPSNLKPKNSSIVLQKVVSADEMYKAALSHFASSDISVFAAAVADYTPKIKAKEKIKKEEGEFAIDLVKTKDIALELGKMKQSHQITVGFALETQNGEENANKKLNAKNLDFVVLNSPNDEGAAFGHETNKIVIFDKNGSTVFPLKSKVEVAQDIVKKIMQLLK